MSKWQMSYLLSYEMSKFSQETIIQKNFFKPNFYGFFFSLKFSFSNFAIPTWPIPNSSLLLKIKDAFGICSIFKALWKKL